MKPTVSYLVATSQRAERLRRYQKEVATSQRAERLRRYQKEVATSQKAERLRKWKLYRQLKKSLGDQNEQQNRTVN